MHLKSQNNMRNVFIIGNGFDLDLGLPTMYTDFANSSFWPKASPIAPSSVSPDSGTIKLGNSPSYIFLDHYLDRKRNLDTWFDLENELLQYSLIDNKTFGKERIPFIEKNIAYYKRLQDSLCDYIISIEDNITNKDAIAGKVLKSVIDNEYFEQIYSFNYTNLNKIARSFGIYKNIDYTHLHGKVENRSIILGVDDSKLRSGYELFHKSSSRYYRSHDIYNALTNANEIVIFGLSFGNIDYSYFDRFFRNLSNGESITEESKKNITIFTKDDNSRLSIIGKLREMDISIQRLYAQSHFQIICTNDEKDKSFICGFIKRMKDNSRAEYDRSLDALSNML